MSQCASLYPVSQSIERIVRNSGYTNFGFVLAFGTESQHPDLESWLEQAEGPESIIATIATAYPEEAEALRKAVAETAEMKVAGVDPVELERSSIEKAFNPYLLAQGDRRTPTQITIFGLTGGFERWHVVWIKKGILEFSDQDQLAKLPILMTEYRQRYKGLVPFFGALTRFDTTGAKA